jgi:hypothetical protein
MEEIINELEDYKGKKLYDYRMIFYSINKKQREWLISHLEDNAWDEGLCIAQCLVSEMPKVKFLKKFSNNEEDIEFQFKSSKPFEDKDWDEWSESDLDEILDTRLVGKGQFFSNIYYSDQKLDGKEIIFFDHKNNEYNVELSKDSSIEKK